MVWQQIQMDEALTSEDAQLVSNTAAPWGGQFPPNCRVMLMFVTWTYTPKQAPTAEQGAESTEAPGWTWPWLEKICSVRPVAWAAASSLSLSWAEEAQVRRMEQPSLACDPAGFSMCSVPRDLSVGTATHRPMWSEAAALDLLLLLFPVGCVRHLP